MENSRNGTRESKVGKVEDKPDFERIFKTEFYYYEYTGYKNGFLDGCRKVWTDHVEPLKQKIERLEEKEIRGDRLIVDLEHQKAVLKSEIRTMEEVVSRVQSEPK